MQENCTKVHFQVQFSFIFAALCDRSFGGIVTNEMSSQGGVRRYNRLFNAFIFAALCDRSFGGIVTNEMSYKAESEGTTGCLMLAYLLHYAAVASGKL